jgi:glutathione S-transferase
MQTHIAPAIVTILAILLYFVMGLRVGQGRSKYDVPAPATSGNADFERLFRVHANTLEWLPIFLPALWLFAIYWNDLVAAGLGVVWIIGRYLYMTGTRKPRHPAARGSASRPSPPPSSCSAPWVDLSGWRSRTALDETPPLIGALPAPPRRETLIVGEGRRPRLGARILI